NATDCPGTLLSPVRGYRGDGVLDTPLADASLSPLAGVSTEDYLEGGYGFLERTQDGVWHPGVDLNFGGTGSADAGAPIYARAPGTVLSAQYHVTSTGYGFGWNVWLETEWGYPHYCHMQDLQVTAGQSVQPWTLLGHCGKTAGWPWEHCHFEV